MDNYLSPADDWWQRYVYDSTQGAIRVLGARYGQGQYNSPDDPRYRQQTGMVPYTPTGYAPVRSGGGLQLSNTTLMLIVGGFLLFTLGRRGR